MVGFDNWHARRALLGAAAALGLAFTLAASVWAAPTDSAPFATRARAAVLMDGDTGAIMFQHNADELMPPASVSKLMTLEIAFQAIKDGRLKLDCVSGLMGVLLGTRPHKEARRAGAEFHLHRGRSGGIARYRGLSRHPSVTREASPCVMMPATSRAKGDPCSISRPTARRSGPS